MTARVLIIDDESIYSKSIALYLTADGYHTITKEGGLAGLNYLDTYPEIDIILLDLMMPDIYGLDVLQQIKVNPLLAHIPVILQTGMLNEAEIHKGLELGALDCLRKPFKRQELINAVTGALDHIKTMPMKEFSTN